MDNLQSHDSITLAWPTATTYHDIAIPKSTVPDFITNTFLSSPSPPDDDEELPISTLLYRSLLSLPPDIRAHCLPRVIFTGHSVIANSIIPSLRPRILAALTSEINDFGWSAVRGARPLKHPKRFPELHPRTSNTRVDASFDTAQEPGKDYVEEKLAKMREKEKLATLPVRTNGQAQEGELQPPHGSTTRHGEVRAVDSLGAWAGASLLMSLKVKGVVEIERSKFLDHGLAGASRDMDVSVVPQRVSSLGMGGTAKGSERTSWTLGVWG
jgi:hypothetical protein